MKITLSKYIGFCDGIRCSIAMACDEARIVSGNVYTDGELIHNSNTLRRLMQAGIGKLQDTHNLCKNRDSIVIRAHGITPARRKMLEALGCKLIDATCPRALKIAGLLKKYFSDGHHTILAGDGNHLEIIGLCGYSPGKKITVLSSVEEVLNLDVSSKKIVIFSQTTFEHRLFDEIANAVCERFGNIVVKNTICLSTINRSNEVFRFVENGCECIIVVGSKFSKNTKSLYSVALASGCYSLLLADN